MRSLLVVCEGNICRSPMAQGLLAAALPGIAVRSAGLGALIGAPADPIAVKLMQELRIDISAHRAVQITRQMCLEADLVLVMSVGQRRRIEEQHPQAHGRVIRVGEFIQADVPDPYRQSEDAFRQALSLLVQGVDAWLPRIQKLANQATK
ncbi:low molecular weight phosphotyrosine protein phosphatase [Ramlibacter sp. XY19]|uniref:low molecular weight protein-tyrosine-phosphatase n=1 Tax=Ramlibacter paludis TaxID=2908000 RepID=UPI0023DADD28|nr:low molecular weight protein-tyrosine-phosphatase [Ramlibacter paludis]MCG2592029.1 low molecular weight phosphotyrosine protein phosphatase [Ramlibacter paludis]